MTLKEIAKLANVSQGTVDRVVHERGRVSPKTKEKILKILKEVNYKPNIYARGLVLNKTYEIVALLPEFVEGEYWQLPTLGVLKGAKDLEQFGVKLTILSFDQKNADSFLHQVNKVLAMKPDGVILAPVINVEALKLTEKLAEINTKFTIIDSNLDTNKSLSFVGQDAYQSGRLAASLMIPNLEQSKTILIISIKSNENHNSTLKKRIDGFYSYINESEDNIDLGRFNIDERDKSWYNDLQNLITASNATGIFVPSSKVHHVAKFLENADKKIHLIGYDLIAKNSFYLEKNVINYIIGQRPENQGYIAMYNFYRALIAKEEVKNLHYLPIDIISKENLMYYKDDILN